MKFLFLNTNIGYGGASKMMVWVANQFAQSGHEVVFLTYRDSIERQKLNEKVKHIHFDLEDMSGNGKSIFHTVHYLRAYIKEQSFNIAVAFLPPSQIRLSLACVGLKTKLLFSHRGDPYQRKNSIKMKIAEDIGDFFFTKADFFVFQTEGAKSYYSRQVQDRSVVIPNPINRLNRTQPRINNIENRIVCVARLDLYQKRQDVLIDAFMKIADKYPDYCLEFYGDGAEEDERKLRERAKACERIIFKGPYKDIVASIQNAAIGVLSSDFEGIPNALLEYMSLGIPSISTDCSPGGAAMIINNEVNGLLVPRNNPKSLSDAISYMLENSDDAEKMGAEGTKVIDKFSETLIRDKWLDIIKIII